jgi:fimbrial chaperone protein
MNACLVIPTRYLMPIDQAGTSMIWMKWFLLLFAALLIWLPQLVNAGSFSVTPLRIDLSKSESTRVINLHNLESKPVTVQLQMLSWSHKDGTDQLTSTRDVIVTPQVFHLKPNSLQIIRAGLLRKPDANEELSYRLIIEEIPEPPSAEFTGAQLALKITLPVFVAPEKTSKPQLEFQSFVDADGKLKVRILNHGKVHTKIQKFVIFTEGKAEKILAKYEKPLYVLPGQARNILLKTEDHVFSGSDKLIIRATSSNESMDFYASAGPP